MKIASKKEVVLWASCMAFGAAILLFELAVANARAESRASESALDCDLEMS